MTFTIRIPSAGLFVEEAEENEASPRKSVPETSRAAPPVALTVLPPPPNVVVVLLSTTRPRPAVVVTESPAAKSTWVEVLFTRTTASVPAPVTESDPVEKLRPPPVFPCTSTRRPPVLATVEPFTWTRPSPPERRTPAAVPSPVIEPPKVSSPDWLVREMPAAEPLVTTATSLTETLPSVPVPEIPAPAETESVRPRSAFPVPVARTTAFPALAIVALTPLAESRRGTSRVVSGTVYPTAAANVPVASCPTRRWASRSGSGPA
ncbi:MAG: hypothetical protein DYH06_11880 [Acidobacteria bacterium ACB2]|nr:hypothetical protein [Acidobacteria bacterium ACB2]